MRINPEAPGFDLVLDVDEATHGNRINLEHVADREERNMKRRVLKDDSDTTWRLIIGKQTEIEAPGDWVEQAACRGHQKLFVYPQSNILVAREAAYRGMSERAVAICHRCPVLIECRRWALTSPDPAVDMVAGGLTPWERRAIRRKHLKPT
jgi:WhiB family redox-sensing transcriptional regulator